MAVISARRGPVIGLSVARLAAGCWRWSPLLSRGRLARPAVRVAGLAVVYLPLVLLLGAALEPGESGRTAARRSLGAPLLAALTLLLPARLPGAGGRLRR